MESFSQVLDRLGAKPVPKEQVAAFERAMVEKVIPECIAYQREQMRLRENTRRRIILGA